jgi:hypothetical protein
VVLLLSQATAGAREAVPVAEGEPRQPDVSGYRRLGPLFYQPLVCIRAFGYDGNVLLDRGDKQGDVMTTLGPELRGLFRLGSRGWVSFHGSVDYTGYARHSWINHFDNARGVRITSWLGDLRLNASYDARRALRRPSSEVDDRVRLDESVVRLAALYELTPTSAVEAAVSRSEESYERVGDTRYDALLGHSDSALTITGRHRVAPSTWAVLDDTRSRRDSQGRGGLRDLRQHETLAGFDFEPGARIQGSVRLGVATVTTPGLSAGSRAEEFRGTAGRGDLSVKALTRSLVKLAFRREFTPSSYLDNIYFRNDNVEVSLLRELTSRLAAEVGLSRGRNDYPDSEPIRRSDRISELFVGAHVRLGTQAILAIRAGRWSRESNVEDQDRDRFVITQSISVPL